MAIPCSPASLASIGAAVASVWTPRLGNRLRAYAAVEACVGVFALLFHTLFTRFTDYSFEHVIPALGSSAAVDAWQWGGALLLLLPRQLSGDLNNRRSSKVI